MLYLLADATKQDYLVANYFVFGAPPKECVQAPSREAVSIGRQHALLTALRNGATTLLDPGGGPGDWEDYISIVGQIGARVFYVGLGTDTYPLDIVSEMRYALLLSRVGLWRPVGLATRIPVTAGRRCGLRHPRRSVRRWGSWETQALS